MTDSSCPPAAGAAASDKEWTAARLTNTGADSGHPTALSHSHSRCHSHSGCRSGRLIWHVAADQRWAANGGAAAADRPLSAANGCSAAAADAAADCPDSAADGCSAAATNAAADCSDSAADGCSAAANAAAECSHRAANFCPDTAADCSNIAADCCTAAAFTYTGPDACCE